MVSQLNSYETVEGSSLIHRFALRFLLLFLTPHYLFLYRVIEFAP